MVFFLEEYNFLGLLTIELLCHTGKRDDHLNQKYFRNWLPEKTESGFLYGFARVRVAFYGGEENVTQLLLKWFESAFETFNRGYILIVDCLLVSHFELSSDQVTLSQIMIALEVLDFIQSIVQCCPLAFDEVKELKKWSVNHTSLQCEEITQMRILQYSVNFSHFWIGRVVD